ncbi:SDR family NAD(P)-dependent oxidoreductase [bacterium]|nr:SDR family NAD(P)-dependent oxidoreductase [bacterium]
MLGGLSAIAQATARLYAAEGARIMLVGRNADRLSQVAADLRARGAARSEVSVLDLAAAAPQARDHLTGWSDSLGGIDHIHLAYGVLGEGPAPDTLPDLASLLDVNFTSAALWSEAAVDHLATRGRGALVVIGSVAGDRGRQSNYAYGAAKGGLALFVQGLAHRVSGSGVRVALVKPGFVDTPMTDRMKKGGPLWATPDAVARTLRRAADRGGPIHYAPWFWRFIMLAIRATPALVFHRTKL